MYSLALNSETRVLTCLFFLSSSVSGQIEREREGGADRERGRESKEEEEEEEENPEIAPGLRILPPSFALLFLVKNNEEISPGSSGSSILPFPYYFLTRRIVSKSSGNQSSRHTTSRKNKEKVDHVGGDHIC